MSNTERIPLNLNQKIRVRLTDEGRSHLYKLHCATHQAYPELVPYNPPTEVDGWAEFQPWDFIGKFGAFCQTPGFDIPFSPDIELVIED